jgi:hypothetical protein
MAIIYDSPAEAMRRLMELGVPLEALQRAIAAGHVARITCTENDPPFIPGTEAWRFTVRTLREELCPTGVWRKADPGNFSLVINDTRKINIVVESGDEFTRLRHALPKTKSLKGLYVEASDNPEQYRRRFFPRDHSRRCAPSRCCPGISYVDIAHLRHRRKIPRRIVVAFGDGR